MTTHARDMARAVDIPIIADADTGYGGPANIARTVEEYRQAGVAAIHLEDQTAPKRCGQLAGITLISAEANVRRLKCALAARGSDDLLIIGRTDAMPAAGAEEAIRRAKLYQDAGVDLVFVDGIKNVSEVEAIARAIDGPKVVSIVDGNETTRLTARDLQKMGFSVVFYAVSALFSAAKAVSDTLAALRKEGTPRSREGAMMSYAEFSQLVDLDAFKKLDDEFGWS
jgi:2-methylisocitrate lyase-like PEP mutase family enzyme